MEGVDPGRRQSGVEGVKVRRRTVAGAGRRGRRGRPEGVQEGALGGRAHRVAGLHLGVDVAGRRRRQVVHLGVVQHNGSAAN